MRLRESRQLLKGQAERSLYLSPPIHFYGRLPPQSALVAHLLSPLTRATVTRWGRVRREDRSVRGVPGPGLATSSSGFNVLWGHGLWAVSTGGSEGAACLGVRRKPVKPRREGSHSRSLLNSSGPPETALRTIPCLRVLSCHHSWKMHVYT